MQVIPPFIPLNSEPCEDVTLSDAGYFPGPPERFHDMRGKDAPLLVELTTTDPVESPEDLLARAALTFLRESEPDTEGSMSRIYADLAVTGKRMYGLFRVLNGERLERDLNVRVADESDESEDNIAEAVAWVLDRAYRVAWAIDGPPQIRAELRPDLDWCACMSEFDHPHRPVNVPSAPYPQYNIEVSVDGRIVDTRFMIASEMARDAAMEVPRREAPASVSPHVPEHNEVIIYIHGHSSRAEEAVDFAPAIHDIAPGRGRSFSVISLDLPSCGYSSMLEHTDISNLDDINRERQEFPVLSFYDRFIVEFVNALDAVTPIKHRIAAIVGGSLGGNMTLRLSQLDPVPEWLPAVVSWSAASVWYSVYHQIWPANEIAVGRLRGRASEEESRSSRQNYFDTAFGAEYFGPFQITDPQPTMWYRDDWQPCKDRHMLGAQIERHEIYNNRFRRWHWRVALEQIVFSHWDGGSRLSAPNYLRIGVPLLFMSGEEDNYNNVNIYDHTRDLAELMNTPGRTLLLKGTGHSIHNERPRLLATEILNFLADFATSDAGLREFSINQHELYSDSDNLTIYSGLLGCSGQTLNQGDGADTLNIAGTVMYRYQIFDVNNAGHRTPLQPLAVKALPVTIFGETYELPPVMGYVSVLFELPESLQSREQGAQLLSGLVRQRVQQLINDINLHRLYGEALLVRGSSDEPISMSQALAQAYTKHFHDLAATLNDSDAEESLNTWIGWLSWPNIVDAAVHFYSLDEFAASAFFIPVNVRANGTLVERDLVVSGPRVPLNVFPDEARLQVTSIATRNAGYASARTISDEITYFGGVAADGTPWIANKPQTISRVLYGRQGFYIRNGAGGETPLILGRHPISDDWYLRSSPNHTTDDNLYSMPELGYMAEER